MCVFFPTDCGPEDEDELYESHIIKTNMVYQVVDNSLMPYEEYWGMQPKYEMLKKDKVLTTLSTCYP